MGDEEKKGPSKEEQKELEVLLSELGGGRKIIIDRKTPSWCDGHVQTIEIASDDSISLEDIEREIGGHKFEFKIYDTDRSRIVARRTVKFSGSPPRKYGRVVKRVDEEEEEKKTAKGEDSNGLLKMFMESQKQMAQIQADNQKALAEMQQKSNDTVQQLLMQRLEEKTGQTAISGHQSLKEAMELVEFVEGVKERIKGKDDNENPVTNQMMDMANTFLEFKLGQETAKIEREIKREDANKPTPLPERSSSNSSSSSDSSIDGLEDSEVLQAAAKRFKKLSTEQQKAAFELFLSQVQEDEQNGSIQDNENNIESDDNISDTDNKEYTDSELSLDSEDEQELDGDRGQAQTLQEEDPASA